MMTGATGMIKKTVLLILMFYLFLPPSNSAADTAKDNPHLNDGYDYYDPFDEDPHIISDPLEPWNRLVFRFNDRLYFIVYRPVAKAYNKVVPEFCRRGAKNAFNNASMPVRFINSLFQLKPKSAGIELVRFCINSTAGIGGLFDIAKRDHGLVMQDEDFGQTLGHYGVGNGFYLVLPFLGPSTLRDGIGLIGDTFSAPYRFFVSWPIAVGISGFEFHNKNSFRIGEYEAFKEDAIEPYSAMRTGYIQLRNEKIRR